MNRWVGMGRLTKDPDTRYTEEKMAVSRYTLAIDRQSKEKKTDFISCIAFGKTGEFAEKYLHKGMKIAVEGRIQTGSYEDKDGHKRYTTDVIVEKHFFCESKGAQKSDDDTPDDFMNIQGDIDDECPFK